MGASILYERVKPGKSLNVAAPQSFLRAMTQAFGCDPPFVLSGREDAIVLRGMAAADPSLSQIYEQLRTLLDDNPEGIRIWAEY